MRARDTITAFFRFVMRVFFRRIEVVGLEKIPDDGAVIFAVNHPNGLVDPLFVLCYAPRPVSFLAKAPLFGYPIIGWFVRTFDSIPVYRKQDNTTGTNAETFGRAREILASRGSIAIFPEGTTHSDPKLRELKTGAARIALGAELDKLAIVPAGIYYKAKHIFRSDAMVVFGDPLVVPRDDGGRSGRRSTGDEPAPELVNELTDRIDVALDSVTLQADSHTALELISRAEEIFTADIEQPLSEELELRRRFIDGYHYLYARDPERLRRLASSIDRFEAELGRANLEVHELRPRVDAKPFVRVLILFPLALLGAIVNWPTYRLIGLLAKQFAKGQSEMVATMKFLAALLLYPLTYLAIAALLWWKLGPVPAVAAVLILPILGYLALRVFEDLDQIIGNARALLLRRHAVTRLRAERRALREEIVAVAEEMGRA